MARDELPVLTFSSVESWRQWLAAEAAASPGVWLKLAKKTGTTGGPGGSSPPAGTAEPTLSYAEALEVALCFGWIDGQKGRLDDRHWLQRFTPRKPGSRWSKINTQKAEALIEAGQMQSAGLREVELAKADGRWEQAYSGQRDAAVPEDLRQALDANPAASEFFETISGVNRFAILYRIQSVKRAETRARKIEQYVQMLAEHKTIHP
jgi:uncharacterized protein YdeI (YjbR/CyaY-like superfamily)